MGRDRPNKPRGFKILERRQALGLTQAELGKRIGIKPNVISNYEWDKHYPSFKRYRELADALGCSVADLMDDEMAERMEMYAKGDKSGLTLDQYMMLAMRTANHEQSDRDKLAEAAMGIAGEAGEVVDHIKKHFSQGHKLNKDEVSKELGDLLWYMAYMAYILELSLDDVGYGNIEKLERRYPNGFDTQNSINREDYE